MGNLRRVRARVHGKSLELLEDVKLPDKAEVTVSIEVPTKQETVAQALEESAGAWKDAEHPDLESRDDVVRHVTRVRAAFERGYGE